MAVAPELLGDIRPVAEPASEDKGKLLVFGGTLQEADKAAFERYSRTRRRLGVPRSYTASIRRGIIVNDQYETTHVVTIPKILGERVVTWSRLQHPHTTYFLNVEVSIGGAHPELGRVVRRGRDAWKTIVNRGVTIDHFSENPDPIVDIKDRLPRKDLLIPSNCDAGGVVQDKPSGAYFALQSSEVRFSRS